MINTNDQNSIWLGADESQVAMGPTIAMRGVGLPADVAAILQRAFAAEFTLVDSMTAELLGPGADQPAYQWWSRSRLCSEVVRGGRAELMDEEDPFLVLGIPLATKTGDPCVAMATFVARRVGPEEDLARAAEALGMCSPEIAAWATRQTPWTADSLRRISALVLEQLAANDRIEQLLDEAGTLSCHIAATYEEISLLHRLTQNLKLSKSDEDLGRLALEWMEDVLPAKGLAIQLMPTADPDESLGRKGRREPILLMQGICPIDDSRQFTQLVEHLDLRHNPNGQPVVINRGVTQRDDWPYPQVRQMMIVPLAEGENLFGWVAAFDHVTDGEFGTGEASLLNSIAVILGIHDGNILLYEQQAELMRGIIRALTAAIDAKDQYTCGHSDRVARIAVRLAQELGCDATMLNTIYLAGLLHDIGKIGITDSVLRKPGKLSDEEYQHIKSHPEIGHRILHDLKKLDNVLPVILHHHEAWNGAGYPLHLLSEQIPLAARIVAVADSYDAMGSDRPYRKGMSDDKIDEIFRQETGRQWDPEVVAAFFRAREDLRQIVFCERTAAKADPQP